MLLYETLFYLNYPAMRKELWNLVHTVSLKARKFFVLSFLKYMRKKIGVCMKKHRDVV